MSENNEKRNAGRQQPRNAGKQDRNSVVRSERAAFDDLGLTKRNADYMFRFNQALQPVEKITVEKKAEIVQSMLDELIEGQKTGMTAKNQYGDIEARIEQLVNGPKRPAGVDDPFWPSALYNGLTFFMFFGVMFGLMMLISNGAQSGQQVGLLSIIFSSVIAGLALPSLNRVFDAKKKHRYNVWMRLLFSLAVALLAFALFYAMAYLPVWLNPVVPAWAEIILALVGGLGAYFVKRRWKLTQSFFSASSRR